MTLPPTSSTSAKFGLLDRIARGMVVRQLSSLKGGRIALHDAVGVAEFGEASDLQATVHVADPRFYRDIALGGALGAAESFRRGKWTCDDLTSLLRVFTRNMEAFGKLEGGFSRLMRPLHRWLHGRRDNHRAGSRKNIGAHYDLGNDFFHLWLDDTWAYSGGVFPSHAATLREASVEKFDRICRKLELRPQDHVVEIGGGWGGFALHAVENYGCRVTTTTISRRQFDVAQERIAAAGLNDRITLLMSDYRDLSGKFDKLVSVEMIEAVGHRYFDVFFRKCGELLKPDGTLLLQAIVLPERWYGAYLRSVDFIQKYIFPGGCLPSIGAMLDSAGRTTDLRFVHAEDFAPHYAETLRRWRAAFNERLDDVRRLGYSEEFIRLWTYYLGYCEAVFEERYGGVVQVVFDKPQCRRDPLRIGVHAAAVGDVGDETTSRPVLSPPTVLQAER